MKVSLNSGTKKSRNSHAKHLDEVYEHAYKVEACMSLEHTFEENEMMFFKENFHSKWENQIERYRKKGNYKKIQKIENENEYMQKLIDSHVSEQVYQLGSMNDNLGNQHFQRLWMKFSEEHRKMDERLGLHRVTLDVGMHFDMDEATPHAHERSVYLCMKNGELCCEYTEALKQAGISLPNPNKKEDKHNNRMITYTDMCRDLFLEVSREYIKENNLDASVDDIDHSNRGKHIKGKSVKEYINAKMKETDEYIDERIKETEEWVVNQRAGIQKAVDDILKEQEEKDKELQEREEKIKEQEEKYKYIDKFLEINGLTMDDVRKEVLITSKIPKNVVNDTPEEEKSLKERLLDRMKA